MHVLYVHQNFPAQFGHIARHLSEAGLGVHLRQPDARREWSMGSIKIQYKLSGGATKQNHFCSRTFENTVWHCDGVYRALKGAAGHQAGPDRRPQRVRLDAVPARALSGPCRSSISSSTTIIPHDPRQRHGFPRDLGGRVPEMKYLRSRCRNAMILLDLQNCEIGYTPTSFKSASFPQEYQPKLRRSSMASIARLSRLRRDAAPAARSAATRTIAGVECRRHARRDVRQPRVRIDARVRHLHASAKLIYQQYPDVAFIIVGTDRIAYGGDESTSRRQDRSRSGCWRRTSTTCRSSTSSAA
jgi:hypothetical protein